MEVWMVSIRLNKLQKQLFVFSEMTYFQNDGTSITASFQNNLQFD